MSTRVLVAILATLACVANADRGPPLPINPAMALADTDPSLPSVTFAPYGGEHLAYEVDMINYVIAMRENDTTTTNYPMTLTNPYRIQYAAYNMQETHVTSAIVEAFQKNVFVQLLIDGEQFEPNRTWNAATWNTLESAGFTFAPSQMGLSKKKQNSLNLISIQFNNPEALMHLKTRLFTWPDPVTGNSTQLVISGSMNPEDAAFNNNETLITVTDPKLVTLYQEKYLHVLRNENSTNSWNKNDALNLMFSPNLGGGPNVATQILNYLSQESAAVFISMYALREFSDKTYGGLYSNLLDAWYDRNATIVIVTEEEQYLQDTTYHLVDKLRNHSIPVYTAINPTSQFNAMHCKNGIFGVNNFKIVTDTANWSTGAMGSYDYPASNDESVMFIDCSLYSSKKNLPLAVDAVDVHTGELRALTVPSECDQLGLQFLSNHLALVRFYQPQSNNSATDQVPYETIMHRVSSVPGYYNLGVTFQVYHNTSDLMVVTGTSAAIGSFVIQLTASSSVTGLWSSQNLAFPFGDVIEYQFSEVRKGDLLSASIFHELVVDPTFVGYSATGSYSTMSVTVARAYEPQDLTGHKNSKFGLIFGIVVGFAFMAAIGGFVVYEVFVKERDGSTTTSGESQGLL